VAPWLYLQRKPARLIYPDIPGQRMATQELSTCRQMVRHQAGLPAGESPCAQIPCTGSGYLRVGNRAPYRGVGEVSVTFKSAEIKLRNRIDESYRV